MVSIELWTDGSGTREAPGGWAYLLRAVERDGEVVKETEDAGGDFFTTSQRMEITAVLEGLRALKPPTIVTLYTDSRYVADALSGSPTQLEVWSMNDWRGATGRLKNVDLWLQVHAVLKTGVKVVPRHVKGHSGVEANEIVDQLAGLQRRAFIDAMGEQLTLVDKPEAAAVELAGPESALTGG